jgi:hypothetical protein
MNMASVCKPKGSAKYVIYYYDETGRRRKKAGTTDKGVTQRIANDLENKVAQRKQGLIDPTAERFAESERKPIGQHLDDFVGDMEARARDGKHVRTTRTYVSRILDTSGASRLSDLSSHVVT